MKTKRNFKNTL